jgi:hypothetical protein
MYWRARISVNSLHVREKFSLYIFPEKEFHIHVCERFTYSQDRSTYFPAAEYRQTDPVNIYSIIHVCERFTYSRIGPHMFLQQQ